MTDKQVATIVIGAGGYVGGEFLRLINQHPNLALVGAVSDSAAGTAIEQIFPHLRIDAEHAAFISGDTAMRALSDHQEVALFSAAPHGGAAETIDRFATTAEQHNVKLRIVDASADFRYRDVEDYKKVYGFEHAAPNRLGQFFSAIPEHQPNIAAPNVGHPGCFATAMQLGIVPLMNSGHSDSQFFANGITGATGAGKQPIATTHLPERHSNLFAYKALAHRHSPEVVLHVGAACGQTPSLHFTPHSGPFSRGIHMTINTKNIDGATNDQLRDSFQSYYKNAPFVRVVDGMPRLKNVVASNYADIGIATDGKAISVCVVIDNLVKGAAGGCVQWMNRLLGLDETTGLLGSAAGWS